MEYKSYITRKEACFQTESGPVNIAAGTVLTAKNGKVHGTDGRILCDLTSQQALDVLCQNDDEEGFARGVLLNTIESRLKKPDGWSRKRWNAIWSDDLCQRYKQGKVTDQHWEWNLDFYNASLEDLGHIATLIGPDCLKT